MPPASQDNKFVRGKGEWLFLDNDSNKVNQQISGKLQLPGKKIKQWHLLLEMRAAWLKTKGAAYFFLVSPTKACVYPEFLPPTISLSDRRCIIQLGKYLYQQSAAVVPIYPLRELEAAKQEQSVYPIKDTHWNKLGAFVGYQSLIEKVAAQHRVRVLTKADIVFTECVLENSDLGSKIGSPEDMTVSAKITDKYARVVFHNEVSNRGKLLIFENTKYKYLPKGVIFRDSFSNMMLEFLAESFSRLVAVWQPNIDYDIVLKERPDIVISQQAERFIFQVPDDLKGQSNPEIVASKL